MVQQQGLDSSNSSRVRRSVTSLMAYQGFTMAINRIASPWIAVAFSLNQSGIARLFAWIALSSIGALILSGMADRWGRRRILILCSVATPVCALMAALSADIRSFAIFEVLLYSFAAATVSGPW
jgi:MFS family permease